MAVRNKLPMRSNVPARVYDMINRRDCLHIDAWLYQDGDDTLYFVIRTSGGGQQVLQIKAWRAQPNTLTPVTYNADVFARMIKRQIDSPWARRYYPWLDQLYKTQIQPWLWEPAQGFRGHRSIALWFVHSDPRVCDPFAGADNTYQDTARAARDAAMMANPPQPDMTPKPSDGVAIVGGGYTAQERSIMRSLGKVLGT